jgi:beta-lactamase superfamily II metal-dependent hydrolase
MSALAHAGGVAVFRTDDDGRIVLESDGKRLSVRTAR